MPIALIRARERVMAPIRVMLAASGITEQQWRVLRVLEEFGARDATEVGERASLLLPSLSRIVRTLAERGLITRTQDQTDRRRQLLRITPAGQKIIDDNRAEGSRIVASYREQLGAEKYDLLIDLLTDLDDFKHQS